MTAFDLIRSGLAFEKGAKLHSDDPLKYFKWKGVGQELLLLWIYDEIECYWRAGNQGGKTYGGAAIGVAFARGLKTLDGLPMPKMRVPNVGYVLTQTYKQQAESTQAAYLALLGDHPHHIGWADAANGYVSTIWVKPDNSRTDDFRRWSKIVFHCAQTGRSIPGGRIDWAHADEPPKMQMWREVRSRRRRNEPLYKWITATPLDRSEWEELEADFEGAFHEPKNRRVQIITSVFQNEALSQEHLEKQLAEWEGDPYARARIEGGLVDLSGKCPFTSTPELAAQLGRWLKRSRPPELVTVNIHTERDTPDGRFLSGVAIQYQQWWKPEPGEQYLIVLDPALGINDRYHDPSNLLVFALRRRRLVARYNGYLASYGLGSLGAILGFYYNDAIVDIDMGGGYGDSALRALSAHRYRNFMLELIEERGKAAPETFRIGNKSTYAKKHAVIGDIIEAILTDSIVILSQEVITCLLNTTVDDKGRVAAVKGRHDEDMTNLGMGLVDMGNLWVKQAQATPKEQFDEHVNKSFGRVVIPPTMRAARRPRAKAWWR